MEIFLTATGLITLLAAALTTLALIIEARQRDR